MATLELQPWVYLAAAIMLSVVIGVCVNRLIERRRLLALVDMHEDSCHEQQALRREIHRARSKLKDSSDVADTARATSQQAVAQQEALQVHSRLQAQRIARLEVALRAAEEKQLRLERDVASYKATNLKPATVTGAGMPLLDRRVTAEDPGALQAAEQHAQQTLAAARQLADATAEGLPLVDELEAGGDLAQLMSSDVEIPTLEESELTGSVDDLELDLASVRTTSESHG